MLALVISDVLKQIANELNEIVAIRWFERPINFD